MDATIADIAIANLSILSAVVSYKPNLNVVNDLTAAPSVLNVVEIFKTNIERLCKVRIITIANEKANALLARSIIPFSSIISLMRPKKSLILSRI